MRAWCSTYVCSLSAKLAHERRPARRAATALVASALALGGGPEVAHAVDVVQATLVRTVHTSAFAPPSPDPAGVAYLPFRNSLLVCDSEVDEMSIWAGANVFEVSLSGTLLSVASTTAYSREPTGVTLDPANGHVIFSDDVARRIFVVDPGPDGRLGTGDDRVSSFSTTDFGSSDPEGVGFDSQRGHLMIADGIGSEVYDVGPGANGVFDGVPSSGDDVVTHFDVARHGLADPEGVDFNPHSKTLFVMDSVSNVVIETTVAGTLLRVIDISATNALKPAGLTCAPGSQDPNVPTLYVVDRGVDNGENSRENDGKIYELAVPPSPGAPTTTTTLAPAPPTTTTTTTLPPGSGAVDVRVAASADDAEENASGRVALSSSDLELVEDGGVQTVGMRFAGLAVPRRARILAAWVEFTVDEATTGPTTLAFAGERADSAAPFTSASGDVSGRSRTGATVAWEPRAWPTVGAAGTDQRTPDLAGVIQEIVDRPGWASGNALALIVTGAGHRVAEAFDGDPAGAPLLHVAYGPAGSTTSTTSTTSTSSTSSSVTAPPTSTTTTSSSSSTSTSTTATTVPAGSVTVEVRVGAGADDAEEDASGRTQNRSSDLELVLDRDDQRVGLRFAGVAIPPRARVLRAFVQFAVDEASTDPTSLTVTGQDAGNAPAFTETPLDVSARPRTVPVAWPNVPAWSAVGSQGEAQRTPDLAAILQQIVDRGDWASGNAVVVIVEGTGRRVAESYDGDPAGAALLHVEYGPVGSTTTSTTTSTTSTTVSTSTSSSSTSSTSTSSTSTTSTSVTSTSVTTTSSTSTPTSSSTSTTSTTIVAPPAPQTLWVQVATGDDDAEERQTGRVTLGSSDLELVRDNDDQRVGLRFVGVAIPQGATIGRAWVQFQVNEATTESTDLAITGHDVGNAPPFTAAANDVSARARTAAVAWPNVAAWQTRGERGPAQQSPDLRPILQRLVARGDWASGNAIVLIVEGTGHRVAEAYDGDPAGAATLHVEFH